MPLRSVFRKTIYDRRHGIVWWSFGVALLTLATLSVWPSVRDEYAELVQNYPEALLAFFGIESTAVGSATGYVQVELFSLLVPLTFIAYMVSGASGAIAAEEESGTLDLLLSYPVSRRRVLLEKFGALAASLAVISACLLVALAVCSDIFDLGIALGHLAAATFSAYLLAVMFGALALLASAATGHRALAAGAASTAAIAAYLLSTLASLVHALRSFRPVSPFWWYAGDDPLRHGIVAGHLAAFVGLTVLVVGVAVVVFDRRDIASR